MALPKRVLVFAHTVAAFTIGLFGAIVIYDAASWTIRTMMCPEVVQVGSLV